MNRDVYCDDCREIAHKDVAPEMIVSARCSSCETKMKAEVEELVHVHCVRRDVAFKMVCDKWREARRPKDVTLALVRITDADMEDRHGKLVHIRNTVSTMITLCGWCDVDNRPSKARTPTCPVCLEVVRYCKALVGPGL